MPTPAERFWAKVDRNHPNGCWIWTGSKNELGYGGFRVNNRLVKAHRFAYEMLVGPIAEALVIDHLCMRPPCVNPAHLQPVTQPENIDRGYSSYVLGKWQQERTNCPQGHPYAGANLYIAPRGDRMCRTCRREEVRRRRRRAREAVAKA